MILTFLIMQTILRLIFDNWQEFYPDTVEPIPHKNESPNTKGSTVRITDFKDVDHAHDILTRRSVTEILLMINNTSVKWISKRQKTVETSTYGSELVAAKQGVESILEYRYMLCIMGAKIDESALLLGDNKSVILNTAMPSSVLKKNHCVVSYHKVREMIAAKVLHFSSIDSVNNYADVLTKPLAPKVFKRLFDSLLFRGLPNTS